MLTLRRLQREAALCKEGTLPEGIRSLEPIGEENLMEWSSSIDGPADSPYEGGVFKLSIKMGQDYPLSPPKVKFLTRIYHPNISSSGFICVSLLKPVAAGGTWAAATTLPMLMVALRSLLTDPNPDDPIVESIAAQYRTNREEFSRVASAWTMRYAKV